MEKGDRIFEFKIVKKATLTLINSTVQSKIY